ncbi:PREDICTED: DBH-like monooxygenase protein 1 homolog [Acropora digitifera]|uniref:DBH-like monooxygenase protein 1 homolog n=1 Tax=Acropora digitifera TaxID=70779 RepID=UPI00077A44DB|nr:PREDICTED: DBH-like monooxygenase protein 1 homolog [Acropora digitifera]
MKVNCMIAAVVVFAVFCFAVNNVRAHMHMMMNNATAMSPNGKFQLQWAYDKDTGMFYFNMKCKDSGWCGVGFADTTMNSDGKGMRNYDIAIGGKRGDDQYLMDYWSTGTVKPAVDELNNVTLMNATEMDGYTMVDFKRPANTGDPKDVSIMNDTEVWIMYGSSSSDVTDQGMFGKHADDARQVLPMKYNLMEMAPVIPPTSASTAKYGGLYPVASVILALTARFILSS